jgi:hypothetical protein
MRRLRVLVITAIIASLGGTAWAYWGAAGSGVGAAQTGALNPPTSVVVPAHSTGTVAVSWTASAGTPAPTSYQVTRVTDATGTTAVACAVTTTSCTDQSVPDGTYHCTVTAVYRSWTASSAASGNVVVQVPTHLAFTGQPSTTAAGSAISPAVAVTVEDASGVAVPSAGVQVTVAIGANPAGGTLSGTLTAGTNAGGVASFGNLSVDKAGAGYTLTASGGSLTGATSSSFTVTAATAARFVITSAPVSGSAASSATLGPITVARQDAFGNPVSASTTTVNLASDSSGATFATSAGGSAITSVLITTGSSSATFYYGDTKAGTPTISASGTLATASQTEAITAAAAVKFAITTGPVSGSASATATVGPITVQQQDTFGNPVTAPTATTVSLASDSTGTKIFAATQNGASITAVTIAANSSSTSFYYGDKKAGSPTITASGTLASTTQTETITAAAPAALCIDLLAPNCTSASVINLGHGATRSSTVSLRDQFGNVTTASSPITVTVGLNTGGKGTVSPASLTIPAGQSASSGSFTYTADGSSNRAGTVTVSSTNLTPASISFTT